MTTIRLRVLPALLPTDGREIELQATDTYIQWRYAGDVAWIDLLPLSELIGPAGPNIELQSNGSYIQWRVEGDVAWIDLVPLIDLVGPAGPTVELQSSGGYIQWRPVGTPTWFNLLPLSAITGPIASIVAGAAIYVNSASPSAPVINAIAQVPPLGRLTLSTGVPVMAASVAAATTVFYTPDIGELIPIFDGTRFLPRIFPELSQATTDTTKSPAAVAANRVYDLFVWDDGGTLRLSRGPAWTNNTTRGYNLDQIDGLYVNASAITNGPAAQRGTWVGTIASNGTSTIDFVFGSTGSGGVAASLCVWNAYNRCLITTNVVDTGAGYTYSSNTIRQGRGSAGNQVSYVQGSVGEGAIADYCAAIQALANAGGNIGIGFNSASAYAGPRQVFLAPSTAGMYLSLSAAYKPPGSLGKNTIYPLEQGDGVNNNTFNTTSSATLSVAVML